MRYDSLRGYWDSFPLRTRLLFLGMVLYLTYFLIRSYLVGDVEFFYYSVVLFILFIFLFFNYHELRMSVTVLIGLAAMGLLHFLGGLVAIGGTRLYDLWLIPLLMRYDNLVHSFSVFVLTFLAYNLLRPNFKFRRRVSVFHFSLLLFLVVMGLGAISEVFELAGIVWFGATGVGDYFNNARDLVFNAVGSLGACLILARYEWVKLGRK